MNMKMKISTLVIPMTLVLALAGCGNTAPAASSTAETSAAESVAAESSTVETVAAESVAAESSTAQTVAAESVPAESSAAESGAAQSSAAESSAAESSAAESSKAESSAAESSAAESSAAESSKAESSTTESSKAESSEASSDTKTAEQGHYASVTAMDKDKIEKEIGEVVRSAYVSDGWYQIADMIRYPITINGTEMYDSEDFVSYMIDKTASVSDRKEMEAEDLRDMFVNGQGICMGSGQVWLNDPNYMTDKTPKLEIIAINGIVSKTEGNEDVNTERDFYDTNSVTVYDGSGESFKIYEGSDGYWREEDGTAYVKVSDTEFQRKDGNGRVSTVSGEQEEETEVNTERDFYATPSVVLYDEDGETHTLYEGSDGYWREEDGTAYVRVSHDEFHLKDGDKRLRTDMRFGEEAEEEYERDFYATPSVTVYSEDGEAHKIYEGSDGYWREEDGTAYARISSSEFQLRDSDEIFTVR